MWHTLLTETTALGFNADLFPALDKTGTTKYYFGQYGNAYFGVNDGSVEAVTGNGQASGEVSYWELVDTDGIINGQGIAAAWGNTNNGQALLNYVHGLLNTYYSPADQIAMKSAGADVDCQNCNMPWNGGAGSIAAASAYLWPLSVNEVGALAFPLWQNSGRTWLRSYGWYDKNDGNHYSYFIKEYPLDGNNPNTAYAGFGDHNERNTGNTVTHRINTAFNLDLAKVILPKTALSDASRIRMQDISNIVTTDIKFLINAGDAKSDFTIDSRGEYSVSEITSLNGGTNYISIIVYDEEEMPLYYGNIESLTNTSGKLDLLDILNHIYLERGEYTVAIFQEEKCDSYKTDYASEPCYFSCAKY